MSQTLTEQTKNIGDSDATTTFTCTMCGECCSSINIPIEAKKAEYLLAQDWVKEHLEKNNRSLIPVNKALYRLPLNDENSCVFLGDDKMCLIQKKEGIEWKPEDCRTFPFAGLTLSNGEVVYDTSASCLSVASQLLLNFKPIVPAAGHNPTVHDVKFPKKIKIFRFKSLNLQEYLDFLVALRQLWQDETLSIPALLKATQYLMNHWPHSNNLSETSRKYSGFNVNEGLKNTAVLFFIRKPYGSFTTWNLLMNKTIEDPRVFGVPIQVNNLQNVDVDPKSYVYIRAFLHNILTRKALITYGHSLQSVLAMTTVAYYIVEWYAKVLAKADGRSMASVDDVTLAIRLTERYYSGHQPRFPEFFRLWGQYWIQKLLLG